MLNMGVGEIVLVLVVALVVFGPNRLPQIARNVGRFVGQCKRTWTNIQTDILDPHQNTDKLPEPSSINPSDHNSLSIKDHERSKD